MSEKHVALLAGAKAVSPILLGVIPFGLITGAVSVSAGIPVWGASVMSLVVFAGASQLAAIQLMADHASLWVVVATGLVINARYLMYSASIAPHFNGSSLTKKSVLAYILTDQAYAVSIARFNENDGETVHKPSYYFGTALVMWAGFNASTIAGAMLGAFIPAGWNLDFAIPLTFIALIIPTVADRPALMAALVSGAVALLANGLPYNLGLMAAAASGILVGYRAERSKNHG